MAEKFEKEIHELDHPNHQHGTAKTVEGLSEHEIDTIGGLRTVEVGLSADQVIVELDPAEQTRILRKVDYRLVPLLALLYLLAFIDRGNIGNAKIAGLYDDLKLHGMQYNIALTLFFVSYSFFEVPSQIVLKLVRPSIWISILMFSWGTVMTLMGVISSYQGLLITRFFLGVAEAGFFPAATYLLTIWYKRYEVMRRMAVFYASASLSGAFSGLLAYGIQHMDGISGVPGWKWIFILEGLAPVALSFVVWFLLPDNPETAKFLTKHEKEFIINRLALETGSGHGRVTNSDRIQFKYIKAAFSDWRIYAGVVIFWANTIGVYGFTATVPSVIEGLGYSSANAQLLTIPIYVFAMIITLIFAFMSDKFEQRTPFIMAGYSIAVVGFIGELAIPHPRLPGVTYAFLFLMAAGFYSPFVPLVCLIGNNLAPSSKRAVPSTTPSSQPHHEDDHDTLTRTFQNDRPTSPCTSFPGVSPPSTTRRDVEPEHIVAETPRMYRPRTSTYEVVDQIFKEHNPQGAIHHTSAAIPGGSPEARISTSGVQYLRVSDIVGEDLPPFHVIDVTLEAYANAVHWFMLLIHEPSLRNEIQNFKTTGYVRADRVPSLILAILVIAVGAKYATSPAAYGKCPGFDLDGLSTRFICKAEEKLLDVYEAAGIEAVQISLTLSSFYLYHGRPSRSVAVNGSCLRVAMNLGLHKESSWKMSDPVTRELWRGLSWALYTAEVFGALSYGTPCTISDDDWDVSLPEDIADTSETCPGFASMETFDGKTFGPVTILSYQRYKFRLYRIASSITRNIYRSGAALTYIVGEIKAINRRLQQWEKSIPPELRLQNLTAPVSGERNQQVIKVFQLQALVLQLSYDNIQLVLHRPLLTLNRAPTLPLLNSTTQGQGTFGDVQDDIVNDPNDMIKTSRYQCWVSSIRTSRIGDYAEILSASRNTHGGAYVGIQSFTAGVVLSIFALSDPLSDQAHQAKRAVSKIIKLPSLHKYRTTISDQCGVILEELLRLILAEEMKALLVEGDVSAKTNAAETVRGANPIDQSLNKVNQARQQRFQGVDFDPPMSSNYETSDLDTSGIFHQHTAEIPRDICTGNFSDALLSLQDIRTSNTFDNTTQAWIWEDLIWQPEIT
ncbi:hypothetical protein LTR67_000986 [Exophiala xenobiotica]